MAFFQKCVADDAGEFAGDKDSQGSRERVGLIGKCLHEFLHYVVSRTPQRKPMPRQTASRSLVRKRLTERKRVCARGGKGNNGGEKAIYNGVHEVAVAIWLGDSRHLRRWLLRWSVSKSGFFPAHFPSVHDVRLLEAVCCGVPHRT